MRIKKKLKSQLIKDKVIQLPYRLHEWQNLFRSSSLQLDIDIAVRASNVDSEIKKKINFW
jgi:hypothetical protein